MENPAPQPHPLLLTAIWKTLKAANEWCAIALAHAHKYQYLFRQAIFVCAKLYMTS